MTAARKPGGPAHPLLSVQLLDAKGATVSLVSLLGGRPLVLVFLRHFGCLFAKQQVAELGRYYRELTAAGADVIGVGNGTPEAARTFAASERPPFPLLTDPTGETYCALDFKRGVGTALSLPVLARAWRARRAGFRQTATQGDPLQQGGVVVLAPDGRELYRYTSETAGDHPDLGDVVAAVRARR